MENIRIIAEIYGAVVKGCSLDSCEYCFSDLTDCVMFIEYLSQEGVKYVFWQDEKYARVVISKV